jgi:DNA topoisomerase-3
MAAQYKLVITEKPSVAKAYADVLGAKKRQDGYFEGNGYLISWCVGHLVELVMPQDYDEKYRKWLMEDLPIIPEQWKYRVSGSTRKQFNILEKLMKRKDVKELLCATDAGREGELIFRLVYLQAGCKKPFRRIWLSSMEDAAIKNAFSHPRPGADYDNLYEAARCREQADWIVGINATRLFSCLFRDTLNIGRVMTPTLAMVANREVEILGFVPEPYYVVRITAEGTAFDSRKIKSRDEAMQLARACRLAGTAIVQDISVKQKKENPPLLFDLTSLQREANRRFGFSAQQTLDYAQSLYEKKLLTYPRTDGRYVTSDMEKTIPVLIRKTVEPITGIAGEKQPVVKRLINDAGVTDHTALLPTANAASVDLDALPSGERSILQMVMLRLLSATSIPHVYEETKVTVSCAGEDFSASGKRILEQGWKKYEPENTKESILPAFKKKMQLTLEEIAIKNGQTKPPTRFTEGTLLHAMETAGKDDIPDEAERSGIGTPATRAGIIEKLVRIGFLKRTGEKKTKTLAPTEKGTFLVSLLPEELKSVSMTADWEKKLLLIERGELLPDAFMAEIGAFTKALVRTQKEKPRTAALPERNKEIRGRKAAGGKRKTAGRNRKRSSS